MMEYKGYKAVVEFDDSIEMFHGRVIGTRDVITFQGRSVDELKQALTDSVDDYIEFCNETGRTPEKALSGRFLVRATPDLQRRLQEQAARQGMSFNAYVTDALDWAATAPMEVGASSRTVQNDSDKDRDVQTA